MFELSHWIFSVCIVKLLYGMRDRKVFVSAGITKLHSMQRRASFGCWVDELQSNSLAHAWANQDTSADSTSDSCTKCTSHCPSIFGAQHSSHGSPDTRADHSMLSGNLRCCCAESLFELLRRIILDDGSVALHKLQCGILSSKHGINKLRELSRWKLLRDHGTVSQGALLCGHILRLIGKRLHQLCCRNLPISFWLLVMSEL